MSSFPHSVGRVCQLIAAGVEVNLLDSPDSRNTPLHWAVTYGNKDVVQCLCSKYKCSSLFYLTYKIQGLADQSDQSRINRSMQIRWQINRDQSRSIRINRTFTFFIDP